MIHVQFEKVNVVPKSLPLTRFLPDCSQGTIRNESDLLFKLATGRLFGRFSLAHAPAREIPSPPIRRTQQQQFQSCIDCNKGALVSYACESPKDAHHRKAGTENRLPNVVSQAVGAGLFQSTQSCTSCVPNTPCGLEEA